MLMKRFPWFTLLLLLALLVLATSLAVATTSQVTAVPDHIPTNGVTSLQIGRLTDPVDTIVSLTVTDPSGSVWTHAASAGQTIPKLPSTYNVNFGGASTGWNSNDGDLTQTDEPGEYHVSVLYSDGSRGGANFDASAFLYVPELALPLIIPTVVCFAALALRGLRRRR